MDADRRKGNRVINLYRHPGPVHYHQDPTEVKGWLFYFCYCSFLLWFFFMIFFVVVKSEISTLRNACFCHITDAL